MKKIIVNPKNLHEALSIVQKAIVRQPAIHILENFLFEVSNQELRISATDLRTRLSVKMKIESPPAVQFNAVVPVEIMKYLKKLSEPIALQWTEESYSLEIIEEDGRSKYSGENAMDFPKANLCEYRAFGYETSLFTKFGDMIPYLSEDELRPAMCSIGMVYRNGKMELCATDGHKLLMFEAPGLDNPDQKDGQFILLERRAVNILSSFNFKKVGHEALGCYFNEERTNYRFSFTYGKFVVDLTGYNVDEKYPQYWDILPEESPIKYTIDRHQFFKCLDKALLFANPITHCIELHLNGENKMESCDLELSKEFNGKIGGTLVGDPIRIGFNGELLKEVIDTFKENVTLELAKPNRAMTIKSGGKIALLMPIRLPDPEVETTETTTE